MKLPSKKPKRSRYGTQATSTASATGLKDRLTALKPKQGSKKEGKSAKAKPTKTEIPILPRSSSVSPMRRWQHTAKRYWLVGASSSTLSRRHADG